MTALTVASWNLLDGGTSNGDDTRLRRQLRLLADLEPGVAMLQECQHWNRGYFRLLHLAERILGMRGFLVKSNHDGCHLGLFIRESAGLCVTAQRHDRRRPYWHAVARIEAELEGYPDPLTLVSAHFAPASPAIRLAEAEAFRLIVKNSPGPVIAAGDWNAVPTDHPAPPPQAAGDPIAARVLDTSAAAALEDAGLADAGAIAGDATPTGHAPLPYRCDRIYTTLPAAAVTAYQAITTADGESDHRPVTATFDLAS